MHDTYPIFDADKDNDLYVVRRHHYYAPGEALQDRLLLNDGKENLPKVQIPANLRGSKSCIRDVNSDGFLMIYFRRASCRLSGNTKVICINDGKNQGTDQIQKVAPQLQHLGMITPMLFQLISTGIKARLNSCRRMVYTW